jgi:hypothetical protein
VAGVIYFGTVLPENIFRSPVALGVSEGGITSTGWDLSCIGTSSDGVWQSRGDGSQKRWNNQIEAEHRSARGTDQVGRMDKMYQLVKIALNRFRAVDASVIYLPEDSQYQLKGRRENYPPLCIARQG